MTNTSNISKNISSELNSEISTTRPLSQEQITQYQENGFVIIRGFFDPEEVEPIRKACEVDPEIKGSQLKFGDPQGKINQGAFWSDLGDSLLGVLPRLARMVNAAEVLLGGEVYHWHSKLVQKKPYSEGRFEWHQGYGVWYYDGCLFPGILSCTIGINNHTKENGCLQVIRKSHLMGRIDHIPDGDSVWADPKRMEQVLERLEVVYCELEVGDVVFFHPNTLHASDGNTTAQTRINMTCHYNLASNKPYWVEGREHRFYQPLKRLPDSAIIDGNYNSVFEEHQFISPETVSKTIVEYTNISRE